MDEKITVEHIEQLARRLPRDIDTETDLWPQIATRIDAGDARFGQLRRDIEPAGDLWPGIRARLGPRNSDIGPTRQLRLWHTRFIAAAGVAALVLIGAVMTSEVYDIAGNVTATGPSGESDVATAALQVPEWMAGMLGQFVTANDGTRSAGLGEAARAIERDFLMVQAQRLRIEQALAESVDDPNLREQWSRVYRTELSLIDEAQRLGTYYGTRSAI